MHGCCTLYQNTLPDLKDTTGTKKKFRIFAFDDEKEENININYRFLIKISNPVSNIYTSRTNISSVMITGTGMFSLMAIHICQRKNA